MSDFFLPEALMMDIWLRLSIKSTVRFRCVSKSWCASLSDPHFIHKNLTFSDAANDDDHLLLANFECPHYSVVSHETLLATPLQVPPEVPIPDDHIGLNVISPPCDDLVCFADNSDAIGLWNLTTGEANMVPRLVTQSTFLTLGFGFDEERKEYKIVQILQEEVVDLDDNFVDYNYVAYVYSLRSSNSCWRKVREPNVLRIDDFGCISACPRSYRDGTFYWGDAGLILSFNMSSEVFNVISISDHPSWSSYIDEIYKLKEGSMLIINQNRTSREYEMWALLEFGVVQSLTRLLVIDRGCVSGVPYGMWRNELILQSYNNNGRRGPLLISDPFKRETKEVQIDGSLDILDCLVWKKGKNSLINF